MVQNYLRADFLQFELFDLHILQLHFHFSSACCVCVCGTIANFQILFFVDVKSLAVHVSINTSMSISINLSLYTNIGTRVN